MSSMARKLLWCGLVAFGCLIAMGVLAATAPDDAKALIGAWTPISGELGGTAIPDEVLKTITLRIDATGYEVRIGDELDKGTSTLDQSTTPRSMTLVSTEGANKGKTFRAIYALDGDTLRVCYDLTGTKRPTEFKTAPGSMLYLTTYKRQ